MSTCNTRLSECAAFDSWSWFCGLVVSSATINCSFIAIYSQPSDAERYRKEQKVYDKFDNRIIECLVMHAASLLDKIKQLVQKVVDKHLCKA